MTPDTYTCPRCHLMSAHPTSVARRWCIACGTYLDDLLAFRLYVDGQLADEQWLDTSQPHGPQCMEARAEIHSTLEGLAADDGRAWCVEIYGPARNESVKMGSKAAGMTDATVMELDDPDVIVERMSQMLR